MIDKMTLKQRAIFVKAVSILLLTFVFFVGTMLFMAMFEHEIYATLGQYGQGDGTIQIPILSLISYIAAVVAYYLLIKWIIKLDLVPIIKRNLEKQKEKKSPMIRKKK